MGVAVEWKITIEGRDEYGDVRRKEICIDKRRERLFDGEIGLSIEDGKKIMAALQSAVVNHEAEAYALSLDRDIPAVKWRLWHGRVDHAIRDLEGALSRRCRLATCRRFG